MRRPLQSTYSTRSEQQHPRKEHGVDAVDEVSHRTAQDIGFRFGVHTRRTGCGWPAKPVVIWCLGRAAGPARTPCGVSVRLRMIVGDGAQLARLQILA